MSGRGAPGADGFAYDVALSFAGEQRAYVARVASALRERGLRLFYDEFEQAEMWGAELTEYLEEVYARRSRYCVMFASVKYADKMWTVHERRTALVRALQSGSAYVLPVRFDDTEIPGLRASIAYVDARRTDPLELAELIAVKLEGGRFDRDRVGGSTGRQLLREAGGHRYRRLATRVGTGVGALVVLGLAGYIVQQSVGGSAERQATVQVVYDQPGGCSTTYEVTSDLNDDPDVAGMTSVWIVTQLAADPAGSRPDPRFYAKARIPPGEGHFTSSFAANMRPGVRKGRILLIGAPNAAADAALQLNSVSKDRDPAYPDGLRVDLQNGAVEIAHTEFADQRC